MTIQAKSATRIFTIVAIALAFAVGYATSTIAIENPIFQDNPPQEKGRTITSFRSSLPTHRGINGIKIVYPNDAVCPVIKSDFESWSDIDGNIRGKIHTGIDIVANEGTPVLAAADGIVKLIVREKLVGSMGGGNAIAIYHNPNKIYNYLGAFTLYSHLRAGSIKVTDGQKVSKGQKIAEVGDSGYSMPLSRSPHLDFMYVLTVNGDVVISRKGNSALVFFPNGIPESPHLAWSKNLMSTPSRQVIPYYKPDSNGKFIPGNKYGEGFTYPVPCIPKKDR